MHGADYHYADLGDMPQPSTCACCSQVIDAEMQRRKLLEDSPIASTNEDPVFFDTAQIPWWAWVKRFHLPEVRLAHFRTGSVLISTCLPQYTSVCAMLAPQGYYKSLDSVAWQLPLH